MKIWVVIPAYNEVLSLESLLNRLGDKNLSILVIDDGSIDATYKVAKAKADVAIKNEKNLGKGLALNKAISYLFDHQEFDYLIFMDADGQHSPEDIDKFFEEAEKGSSFVIGNRMVEPLGMPYNRVVTNKFMSWLISKIIGQQVPDSQCGFRMIKRQVLEKIAIKTKKFEIESEILIKAAKLGFDIKSMPIKTIYFKNPHSKIRPFRDAIRFITFIAKVDK
ncbi:MAG: glycosyltransferase family 2 protein [Candidatus Omnitrophica bacterium]|nr:glycosyltransferase family 2 protein [Candidatus Omnitrophota bacterium]